MAKIRCGCAEWDVYSMEAYSDDGGDGKRLVPASLGCARIVLWPISPTECCSGCGAKFTLANDVVSVGPSVAELEQELEQERAAVMLLANEVPKGHRRLLAAMGNGWNDLSAGPYKEICSVCQWVDGDLGTDSIVIVPIGWQAADRQEADEA